MKTVSGDFESSDPELCSGDKYKTFSQIQPKIETNPEYSGFVFVFAPSPL